MERALKGKDVMITHREPPKRCPRCESTNTKFCYFNNYSQSQPRHYCKACRRYWTEGGTLRNIPQGRGSYRKGKRPRNAPAAAATTSHLAQPATGKEVVVPMPPPTPPPPFFFGGGGLGCDQGVMGAFLQPFHLGCAAMMADMGGFTVADNQAHFAPTMLPGFLNLPTCPQLPPPLDPNLMIQSSSLAVTSHQQMNITVFTSTTTGPAVTAADAGNSEGFWNEFSSGGEDGHPQPPTSSA